MKRVLMIAYFFPPVGGIGVAGAQRVLKFAKYIRHYNWQPVVLTAKEEAYESYLELDQALLEKVPVGVQVVRTSVFRGMARVLELKAAVLGRRLQGSSSGKEDSIQNNPSGGQATTSKGWYQKLKDGITDLFEIPDEEMGWLIPGILGGVRAYRQIGFDAIFSTGRPWTGLVIGLVLKWITGKPLVVDFRDPWMTNPFRIAYSPVKDRLERWLERLVVEYADIVIANTTELQEEFVARFSKQPAEKFVAMLNGFDPEEFERLTGRTPDQNVCTITHTGFLYGKRDPINFLDGLRRFLESGKGDRRRCRVNLIGSVELSYDLTACLIEKGLQDVVHVQHHVPYEESLRCLEEADVLLLLQPGTKTQVPSKLFDYVGMRKPILGISPLDGATAGLMSKHHLGLVCDPDDPQAIADALSRLYEAWTNRQLSSLGDPKAQDTFDVRIVSEALAVRLSALAVR